MNYDHDRDLDRSYELQGQLDRDFEREPNRTLVPRPRKRQFRCRAGMWIPPAEAIPEAA